MTEQRTTVAAEDFPMRIGRAAACVGVHPQTLRIYERAGLLRPRRSPGNARLYDRRHLLRLAKVLQLTREQGFHLAAARRLLELEDRIRRLERQNRRLRRRLSTRRRPEPVAEDASCVRSSAGDDVLYCRPASGI